MPSEIHNLLKPEKSLLQAEQSNLLMQTPHLRLEQIISYATPSAENFWYDQDESEWVMLAQGEAVLEFEKERNVELRSGDYLLIPAHEKHRVKSCSEDAIWLALFFRQ